jgi:hypothetical protein
MTMIASKIRHVEAFAQFEVRQLLADAVEKVLFPSGSGNFRAVQAQ